MRLPKRIVILGLDLSLRRPAAVVIPDGWELGRWDDLARLSFEPFEVASDRERYQRIGGIVARLIGFARERQVTYAFVEQYAFSKSSSSVTKLAELGGHARVEFLRRTGLVLRPVVASQARRQLLGALPRKDAKLVVQLALGAAGAPFPNDDECDAFTVANFGLTELGLVALSLA
jgi:Holliday junction resolvasome RuvABC endonuclease subunit